MGKQPHEQGDARDRPDERHVDGRHRRRADRDRRRGPRARAWPAATVAYPTRVPRAAAARRSRDARRPRPTARRGRACLAEVERELTERHAEAVLRFMGDRALQPSAIDVIGFHGQTVLHRPERRPDGAARRRPAAGASSPASTWSTTCARPTARPAARARRWCRSIIARWPPSCRSGRSPFVNIGGVANVTWIGRDGALIAFDTGPGNALIDDWMRATPASRRRRRRARGRGASVDEDDVARLPDAQSISPRRRRSRSTATPSRSSSSRELVAGGRRGDADRLHRRGDRPGARAHAARSRSCGWSAAAAARNRTLMSMIAGARRERRGAGRGGRARRRQPGGGGLGLSRGALAGGLPITFPGTTGVPAADDGRRTGEGSAELRPLVSHQLARHRGKSATVMRARLA